VEWTYFLWCPLVFGLVLGWFQSGLAARHLDTWASIGLWIPLSLIRWWGEFAGTAIVHRLLRRWRPSLEQQLMLGLVTGGALSFFPARWYVNTLLRMTGEPPLHQLPWHSPAALLSIVVSTLTGISILWFATNELFERVFGFTRFSYAEPAVAAQPENHTAQERSASLVPNAIGSTGAVVTPAPPRRDPAFTAHLTAGAFADVVALQAEDHYIRVHTKDGTELILYRFRDAVAEIAGDLGVQTHRSFWVRRSAITELISNGYAHSLLLSTGARVPVSRSHLNDVRAAADHGIRREVPDGEPTPRSR
jgi:hypothetical protein